MSVDPEIIKLAEFMQELAQQQNEVNNHISGSILAITSLLIQKGIITVDELIQARVPCEQLVRQMQNKPTEQKGPQHDATNTTNYDNHTTPSPGQ